MKNRALVVIDLQNDITKHYREIIDRVNQAIDWAIGQNMYVVYIQLTTCLREQGPSSPAAAARSWCRR